MLDPISLALATPIATVVLNKFYEGLGSKLSEKTIALVEVPIKKLAQLVWERCFRGKPDVDQLLNRAAAGSPEDLQKLQSYLFTALDNPDLAKAVQPLAQDLQQVLVKIEASGARNVQTVTGGQGLQVNDPQSQVIQAGDNARFYFGTPPQD